MFNKLLSRQIQKHFGGLDKIPESCISVFKTISDSYDHYEKDRKMLERSIVISSDEMIVLNENLRNEKNELKKAHKELELKNKELQEFAYIASHDLQEPLRTTSSFVQLLQKNYHGKLDEKADKYLTFITDASERMKILIKNLLEYSLIGKKQELEQINCTKLMQELLDDLSMVIQESKAEIKTGTLPVIRGYRTEIKQLFQNLIINAIKFRKKDVQPQLEIVTQKTGDCIHFSFRDNGIGIEKEDCERVFIIFQRLHSRNEYEGSGIGLAQCKKIVDLHDGTIWVESEPGVGSTFCFTIPDKKI